MYTIIVPFYKGRGFLDSFFHQVLNQTLPFEKLIFINDGDNEVSKKDILQYSKKIHYIDNKINKGVNESVTFALSLVETDFVKIMSIDDIFDKNHALNALNILSTSKDIAMSYTNPGHYILKNNNFIEYDFNISRRITIFNDFEFLKIYKKKTFKIFSNSVFFRTKILNKFLFCFEDIYSKYADQMLNTLIALNYKTVFMPKVDSFWTIHQFQNNKNFNVDIIKLLKHFEINQPIYYKQLSDCSFFYDLNLNDFLKILYHKNDLINRNLFKKFLKFYSWKKLKNIMPTKLIKKFIYLLN